jgi:hypothetical protein
MVPVLGARCDPEANVAQHGQGLPEDSTVPARLKPVLQMATAVLQMATAPVQDGQPTQASMQLAWMQDSLRRGRVLPGTQAEDTAAAR